MTERVTTQECPNCGSPMTDGFIATRQSGGSLLFGGLKCSKVWFCNEYKMGFSGVPKGIDVSTKNSHKKYMAIPAVQCAHCKLIIFAY